MTSKENTPLQASPVYSANKECSYSHDIPEAESGHLQSSSESKDKNEEQGKAEQFQIRNVTKQSLTVLALCSLASFNDGAYISVMAPFYPQEAARKDVSVSVTGVIFASFGITFMISSPIFGSNMNKIGVKFMYISGIIVAGSSLFAFGFLVWCPPGVSFIALSLFCRILEAIGASASYVAGFAILAKEFPKHVTSVYGVVITSEAIGLMVGPTVGGALYEAGGFAVPFFALGALSFLNASIIWKVLPPPQSVDRKSKQSIRRLIRSPIILLCTWCILVQMIGLSFFDPVLANHLRKFNLTPLTIGMIFVIPPGVHAIMAPIWGMITDRKNIQSPLLIMGNGLGCVAMLIIGPSPLLPFLPFELWTSVVGLLFYGLAAGAVLIASLKCHMLGAFEIGFEDNIETYGMVSGLFSFSFSTGAYIGPLVGGGLVQNIGFPFATSVVAGFHALTVLITSIFFIYRKTKKLSLDQ